MPIDSQINDNDISLGLQQSIVDAIENNKPVYIQGGNSKAFYGNLVEAKTVEVSSHTGVIDYDPTELCITVRAGTRLSEIETLLAAHQQILPFEPPMYSNQATIGGAIAAGISGPRRAYTGSVRDAILGVQIINGHGEIVTFGGQVMKNVAGYDLSRLMVASQGTLGLILNVSIRLLPKPIAEHTAFFESSQQEALDFFQAMRVQQLPISATAWHDKKAYIRISASQKIIDTSLNKLKKQKNIEPVPYSVEFWQGIRDQQTDFFKHTNKPLWRLSLPQTCGVISQINDDQLIEWSGAQRWVNSNLTSNIMRTIVESYGGFATCFKRGQPGTPKFTTLQPAVLQLHKQLKSKMDPNGIFNPNRMYSELA